MMEELTDVRKMKELFLKFLISFKLGTQIRRKEMWMCSEV
jgi:hypothetical protein